MGSQESGPLRNKVGWSVDWDRERPDGRKVPGRDGWWGRWLRPLAGRSDDADHRLRESKQPLSRSRSPSARPA
jgi:hypothetical protein